jgi:hypothetical protein
VNVLATELEGVLVIEPRVFSDARGFFYESYRADRYAAAGLPEGFHQAAAEVYHRASSEQLGEADIERILTVIRAASSDRE